MADFTVVVDHATVARLLTSPTGVVARDMLRRGNNVRDLARRLVNVNTGRLRSSIVVQLRPGPQGVSVRIGSNVPYALFQHDGTGVFGPSHRPIRARAGRVMVFQGLGGQTVFAKTVVGTPGTFYLKRALAAARL